MDSIGAPPTDGEQGGGKHWGGAESGSRSEGPQGGETQILKAFFPATPWEMEKTCGFHGSP